MGWSQIITDTRLKKWREIVDDSQGIAISPLRSPLLKCPNIRQEGAGGIKGRVTQAAADVFGIAHRNTRTIRKSTEGICALRPPARTPQSPRPLTITQVTVRGGVETN